MYDAGRRALPEDEWEAWSRSRSSSGLGRHSVSYMQHYFAQEKAIRAPGDEAGHSLRFSCAVSSSLYKGLGLDFVSLQRNYLLFCGISGAGAGAWG